MNFFWREVLKRQVVKKDEGQWSLVIDEIMPFVLKLEGAFIRFIRIRFCIQKITGFVGRSS